MHDGSIRTRFTAVKDTAVKYRTEFSALLMFVLLMLQRTIFGFRYFPMIDDWFLYYGKGTIENYVDRMDLSVRPFAGIADTFIFTPMADHMEIMLLVLTLMLAAAVYFLNKAFSGSKMSSGAMIMIFIALVPIGFEALYWISASSRIIVALFFTSLCLYGEARYLSGRKKRYLVMFALSSPLAVGFYEMMIPIFFALTVIIMLKHRRSVWIMVFPVVFTAVIICHYVLGQGDPVMEERATIISADLLGYHIYDTFYWYIKVLGELQFKMIGDAFLDGVRVMLEHPVCSVLIVLVSAAFSMLARGEKNDGRLWYDLLMGVALIAAAVSVTFILSYVRIPFRVAYLLCIGAALMLEAVLCRVLPGWAYKSVAFILVLGSTICNIGELSLYKWNYERDSEYCDMVMDKTGACDSEKHIYIFNERSYWYDDRVKHYEYVKAVPENFASITGMIRYRSGKGDINNVMTVHDGDVIAAYDVRGRDAELYYINGDGELMPCYAAEEDGNYQIKSDAGEFIGSLTLEGDEEMKYEKAD